MKKDALIIIRDFHLSQDESDSSTLTVEGSFEKTENGCILEYAEVGEFDGNRVRITLDQSVAFIERTGSWKTSLSVEKGKSYTSIYSTDVGDMGVTVYGNKLSSDINYNGGTIRLGYTVVLTGLSSIKTELEIEVNVTEED